MPDPSGPALKQRQKILRIMAASVRPGARRWVMYDDRKGIFLGCRMNEIKVGNKHKSWVDLYWSETYQQIPDGEPGACSFSDQEQFEQYLPKKFWKALPPCVMKRQVIVPPEHPIGNYMLPASAIQDILGQKYLKKMTESEFYQESVDRMPGPFEEIPFS
jgi:hypothetical protein